MNELSDMATLINPHLSSLIVPVHEKEPPRGCHLMILDRIMMMRMIPETLVGHPDPLVILHPPDATVQMIHDHHQEEDLEEIPRLVDLEEIHPEEDQEGTPRTEVPEATHQEALEGIHPTEVPAETHPREDREEAPLVEDHLEEEAVEETIPDGVHLTTTMMTLLTIRTTTKTTTTQIRKEKAGVQHLEDVVQILRTILMHPSIPEEAHKILTNSPTTPITDEPSLLMSLSTTQMRDTTSCP
jgi:hypothetical protein